MPDLLTKAQFTVNDAGRSASGPNHRVFVFETVFGPHDCAVTIKFSRPGLPVQGEIPVVVPNGNTVAIPPFNSPIKPEGSLRSQVSGGTRIVLFSGKLHTKHRASTLDVCIAVQT